MKPMSGMKPMSPMQPIKAPERWWPEGLGENPQFSRRSERDPLCFLQRSTTPRDRSWRRKGAGVRHRRPSHFRRSPAPKRQRKESQFYEPAGRRGSGEVETRLKSPRAIRRLHHHRSVRPNRRPVGFRASAVRRCFISARATGVPRKTSTLHQSRARDRFRSWTTEIAAAPAVRRTRRKRVPPDRPRSFRPPKG